MSSMAVDGLVFASAMVGTVTGHLIFYVYVWVRMRNDKSEE